MIKTKNCAIFGGTFDPIHLGHLHVIDNLLNSKKFDSIVVVPAGNPAIREAIASPQERLEMVKIALKDRDIEISDCEVNRPGTSFAIDTAIEIQNQHPGANLHWVIGSDAFAQISSWHKIEELANLVEFLVVERPGPSFIGSQIKANSIKIDALPISATEIRSLIDKRATVSEKLPANVYAYIKAKGLYGAS
ncbi:MAG: nicotinate (nicotinamide) nucleotide adenylyltransferase [Actinobacteria bacterium]|nr:nicotinate (nicotinamide) nucleotide adenylyltransferase [Actinomycetota bacterium]